MTFAPIIVVILLILAALSCEAQARHYHHRYADRCYPGYIWLRHDRECVSKRYSRREVVPAEQPIRHRETTIEPDTRPPVKRGGRLPAADPAPGVNLPYWEPDSIMGRPGGRWWFL